MIRTAFARSRLIVALAVVGGVAVIGAVVYVLIPNERDVAGMLDRATTGDAVEVGQLDDAGAVDVELDASNTTIGFGCAKTVAGKTSIVRGGWSGKFGSEIQGRVLLDPQTNEPARIEAEIAVVSIWSEHDQLTESLLTQGFFKPGEYPAASFISTDISADVPADTAMPDATHTITGNFTLNGVTRSVVFPAKVSITDGRLRVDSTFGLDRHAFNVRFADGAGYGLLTDENIADVVAIDLNITALLPDAQPMIVEVEDQPQVAPQSEPVAAIDLASLPTTFTETIPLSQVQFKMVLVPGNEAAGVGVGVGPIYMGTHEVTWDEFMPWVQGLDLDKDEARLGEARAMKLRPSAPYGAVDRGFGMSNRPALSMSRLAAELYCEWLSEQTGLNYRLPTEAEWEHAYRLGGGDSTQPMSGEVAAKMAVFVANSFNDFVGSESTLPVGSKQPNMLGLYDMAGNVAEWVIETGEDRVVRGGHFESPQAELGVGRYLEDQSEWNRDYPNEPKSIWWFVNARWVGFRVVCEIPADGATKLTAKLQPSENQ